MRSKITLNYLTLFFIIPFSGFYITKLLLSPIYIFVIIGSFLSLLIILVQHTIKISKELFMALGLLFYFSISQQIFSSPNISAYVNFNFALVVFIISYIILNKTNTVTIINISEKLVLFSIPLLIYEAYYRITHPVFFVDFAAKGEANLDFYYFKVNSIMYQDSNFVGLFILSLIFFLLYLKEFTQKKYYLFLMILSILIFTTISRASIISLILFSMLYLIRHKIYKHRLTVFILSIIIIIILFPILLKYRSIDDSFSTKFGIIDKTILYVQNTDFINLFFGVGFGNAVDVLDIGAHNFFVTYLVESGLIGLILVIIFWSQILYKTKFKAGIVMFPFLLNGMSVSSGAIPYLYAMFAVILVLESRRNKLAQ
jgi:hypothetical protein